MTSFRSEYAQTPHLSAPVNDVMLDTYLCVICNITKCHFMTQQSKYLMYNFSIYELARLDITNPWFLE